MRSILLLLALAMAGAAHAQSGAIQRCTGPDGTSVFTDRRCEDVGARPHLPPPATPTARATAAATLARAGCSRRLSELVQQMRNAVAAQDVNGLSAAYWWAGIPAAQTNGVLERLEAVVQRPLVDIAPVYADGGGDIDAAFAESGADAGARHPVGLRLEQTLRGGATPARTVFGLRRQYGCFWISLR